MDGDHGKPTGKLSSEMKNPAQEKKLEDLVQEEIDAHSIFIIIFRTAEKRIDIACAASTVCG